MKMIHTPSQMSGSLSKRGSVITEEEKADEMTVPEEDEQLIGGLSMFDKIILGSIWGISFIYGVLTEHVLSKQVDVPCSVSDHINTNYGIASIVLALVLPTFVGPFVVTVCHVVISIINVILKNAPLAADLKREEMNNIFCIFMLTIIYLSTYLINMVFSEIFLPPDDNLLNFVILKYIAGTSHQLLAPISILISRPDVRQSALEVYRRGGSTQSKDFEITAEQMEKELGLRVNP